MLARGGRMRAQDEEAALARLETRLEGLEKALEVFQHGVAGRLAQALAILARREGAQDAKVAAGLNGLAQQMNAIRDRLGSLLGPPIVH